MGTRFECVLFGADQTRLRAAAEAAFAEIESLSARWSYFASGSMVFRINREAAERPVALDAETRDILRLALDVWRDSRSCFDITIAPLMRHWGFRVAPLPERGEKSLLQAQEPLSERGATPAIWGSQHLLLEETACTLAFAHPGIEIDLGAIAKGWAIDRAAEVLREAGVAAALLHGGTSSVVAIGSPPHSPRGWPVRLGPFDGSPVVHLRDSALGISAPHGRTANIAGSSVGHVIDPRTGAPTGWAGGSTLPSPAREDSRDSTFAACVHTSAAIADAWSTALLVRGSARGAALPHGLATAVRLSDTWTYSDSFAQHLSPELAS